MEIMNLWERVKQLVAPGQSAPMKEFGLDDLTFFVELLKACPPGSKLSFNHNESEYFVRTFDAWAFRCCSGDFEADFYRVDQSFIDEVERLIGSGSFELDHHFHISGPDDRGLFQGVDDLCEIYIDEEIRKKIEKIAAEMNPPEATDEGEEAGGILPSVSDEAPAT